MAGLRNLYNVVNNNRGISKQGYIRPTVCEFFNTKCNCLKRLRSSVSPYQIPFTSRDNYIVEDISCLAFIKGEIQLKEKDPGFEVDTPYYIITSDNTNLPIIEIDEIISVDITSTTPAGTSIKGLISFDRRNNWKKYESEPLTIALVDGGSDYIGTPAISIVGGGGTGAIATATIGNPVSEGGVIQSLWLSNGGSGYTSVPNIYFGGGGSGAGAIATMGNRVGDGGGVFAFNVVIRGWGFTSVPSVIITGDGSGATAHAIMDMAKPPYGIYAVEVDNKGSGYTYATASFSGYRTVEPRVEVWLHPFTNITYSVVSLNLYAGGSGYNNSSVSITGSATAGASVTPIVTSYSIISINLLDAGSGYKSLPDVEFSRGNAEAVALTGTSEWVDTSLDDLQDGNTPEEIEQGLTDLIITNESYIDFAFDLLTTDSLVTPSIDNIEIIF